MKRCFDVAVASLLLVLTAPAPAGDRGSRCGSPVPGRSCSVRSVSVSTATLFEIMKFRSMHESDGLRHEMVGRR